MKSFFVVLPLFVSASFLNDLQTANLRTELLLNSSFPHRLTLITAFLALQDAEIRSRLSVDWILPAHEDTLVNHLIKTDALFACAFQAFRYHEPVGSLIFANLLAFGVVDQSSLRSPIKYDACAFALRFSPESSDCEGFMEIFRTRKFQSPDFAEFFFAAKEAEISSPEISLVLWTALTEAGVFGASEAAARVWRGISRSELEPCSLENLKYGNLSFVETSEGCSSELFVVRDRKSCRVSFSDSTVEFPRTNLTKHREFGKISCSNFARHKNQNCIACTEIRVDGRRGLHYEIREISDLHLFQRILGIQCNLGDPELCATAVEQRELRMLEISGREISRLRLADLKASGNSVVQLNRSVALAEYSSLLVSGSLPAVRLAAAFGLCQVLFDMVTETVGGFFIFLSRHSDDEL